MEVRKHIKENGFVKNGDAYKQIGEISGREEFPPVPYDRQFSMILDRLNEKKGERLTDQLILVDLEVDIYQSLKIDAALRLDRKYEDWAIELRNGEKTVDDVYEEYSELVKDLTQENGYSNFTGKEGLSVVEDYGLSRSFDANIEKNNTQFLREQLRTFYLTTNPDALAQIEYDRGNINNKKFIEENSSEFNRQNEPKIVADQLDRMSKYLDIVIENGGYNYKGEEESLQKFEGKDARVVEAIRYAKGQESSYPSQTTEELLKDMEESRDRAKETWNEYEGRVEKVNGKKSRGDRGKDMGAIIDEDNTLEALVNNDVDIEVGGEKTYGTESPSSKNYLS